MRRTPRLDFAAIEVIGALLSPDLLAQVAAVDASGQSDQSYNVPPGLRLSDEIARYFTIAEALWKRFTLARETGAGASESFVLDLLKQCFGFDGFVKHVVVNAGDRGFPIRHTALGGRVPIVVAPAPEPGARKTGVDESSQAFADGNRRRSATLLLQEYLSADDRVLWGLASDGCTLRLMRDNASLTRPAWIEADLARIFTGRLFADFALLWLLIHASRFGAAGAAISDCSLERWREEARAAGTAAREHLRDGVEMALLELGQGFIEDPANGALRQALSDGSLGQQALFEQLLRIIYRLIFLFAAEDRGLLHPPDTAKELRDLYATGYSVGRLRERSLRRTAWDRHGDIWAGLSITFAALAVGETRLGLPALGGLFAPGQTSALDGARLANRRLLAGIWRLAWLRPIGQPLTRVNWRDMQTEELGSVYESLLELVPRASASERTFAFASIGESRGSARKTTGSYYTPDALVNLLLDTTLDPVLDAAVARNADDPAGEILKLSIVDPACGSGHFLLGAARRAAGRVAKIRSPGAPSQTEFQHALREVVGRCIYGVDRNPMAVELCKVALWIEALEPGKPLSFLDARIRCGDALIGVFDYAVLKDGIPDEAYKTLAGDNKDTAKAYAAINREERNGASTSGLFEALKPPTQLIDDAVKLSAMPQDTLEQVAAMEKALTRLHSGTNWLKFKIACDLYIAAFFLPKTAGDPGEQHRGRPVIPTTEHAWTALRGNTVYPPLASKAGQIVQHLRGFHWPLEFPQVFAGGGFDVVIGNPPWEVSQLNEQEYFASRSPEISALSGVARKRAIEQLQTSNPRLWEEFTIDRRGYDASNEVFRNSGRFPLTARGKINTYALFAEHFYRVTRTGGRAGAIVPTGIATDSSTSIFFQHIVQCARLISVFSFYEIRHWFSDTDDRKSFCILCIGVARGSPEFCFDIASINDISLSERRFALDSLQIARINPNTKTAPVFRSRVDAELTAKIYDRAPVLIEERPDVDGGNVNPWGITFQQGLFNMTSASEHFMTEAQLRADGWEPDGTDWVMGDKASRRRMPLYEGKMIHLFDHRWATYDSGSDDEEGAREVLLSEKHSQTFEPSPRFWVPEVEVQIRAARVPSSLKRAWREDSSEGNITDDNRAVPDGALFAESSFASSRCARVLAQWLVGYLGAVEQRSTTEADLNRILGRRRWNTDLDRQVDQWLLDEKVNKDAAAMQRETPLTIADVQFLAEGPRNLLELTWGVVTCRQPRWLMGWRDIALRSVERTAIATVMPKVGVGHTLPLLHALVTPNVFACHLANWACLTLDYVTRQKVGGTHLTYGYLNQLPFFSPAAFSAMDSGFIRPRVLELTYTSHALRLWSEDLGHSGAPFSWDEDRRALLRAELDAFFARKYGLTRDELRYVLDPGDAMGPDYPSETFRVLKEKETARFGEYRTRRLVLEAWDRLTGQ